MSFELTPLERTETELGCVVETRRQTNAQGLLIEHVALSCPDPHVGRDLEAAQVESRNVSSLNKVQLIGRLGADPETRYMPNGSAVTNVRLATNESWKDRETGEREERAEFHNVVMFGRLAEVAAEYLRKGSQVFIEGKLRTRKWQDRDGNDRWTTEIIANHLLMLGSPNGNGSGAQRAAAARQSAQSPAEDYGAGGGFYDDIPFGPRLTD